MEHKFKHCYFTAYARIECDGNAKHLNPLYLLWRIMYLIPHIVFHTPTEYFLLKPQLF